jgi:hypothetical protein
MREIVLFFTKPGELVCDPFMGSGATGLQPWRSGRASSVSSCSRSISTSRAGASRRRAGNRIYSSRRHRCGPKSAARPSWICRRFQCCDPWRPPLSAQAMHFKDDGAQVDLGDYLKGDRRME